MLSVYYSMTFTNGIETFSLFTLWVALLLNRLRALAVRKIVNKMSIDYSRYPKQPGLNSNDSTLKTNIKTHFG